MSIDEDRPLHDTAQDEYGLSLVAAKLASSLSDLAGADGMVFGIEGAWGSGKTTFMNFLRGSLQGKEDLHVLTISPWLIGDSRSLVGSLSEAIGPLLDKEEEETGRRWWERKGKKAMKAADMMRGYAARTSRGMAPLAKLAGLAVPGASFAGELMDASANALDSLGKGTTDETVKAEISERIRASGAKFVVIIDDLDRLEPAQAVEVMRLIRSVADFPRIVYVLCYDRQVLAHALETGLSLKDGDLFMQKIVQLTFSLPMPEPFDLRHALRRKTAALWKKTIGRELTPEEMQDLARAVDREGSGLRTPRDVKLVLNHLAFIYPTIVEEVHFPDLCRIALLKALKPKLHGWVENYLGVRAALVSGDASINVSERARMGEELVELLPDGEPESVNSIWSLRNFVPGVKTANEAKDRVFSDTTDREIVDMIEGKRVGSPMHHRFYFALSAPKGMIPVQKMDEIRVKAGTSRGELEKILTDYVEEDRPLGQSWYEHLLSRLDEAALAKYSFQELSGLLLAFVATYPAASRKMGSSRGFMPSLSDHIQYLVDKIIRRMRALDKDAVLSVLERLYEDGDLVWLVSGFHRHHLFEHGIVGDRKKPEQIWVLTGDELKAGGAILQRRIAETSTGFVGTPDFGGFLYGWRDLSGLDAVKAWIATIVDDASAFLWLLSSLRGWVLSDKVYHPLKRESVEHFMDYDEAIARLDAIEKAGDGGTLRTVQELRQAIAYASDDD